MTVDDFFGTSLKKFRIELSVSRAVFAKKLDSAESTIYSYESSRRTPTIDFLQKLIDVYDVDIYRFFKHIEKDDDVEYLKDVILYLERKLEKNK